MEINYDGRTFVSVENSPGGDVGDETIFRYRQQGNIVWADYSGGDVIRGQLIALCDDAGILEMHYQHVNRRGELMTGKCRSTPERMADGRIRLREEWQWTSGDRSAGTSVVEELIR